MSRVQQPSGSIKLTNVSIVRMRKAKKRFELACYKNKVLEWRNGVEKDIDEVLQIHQVFLNTSKGAVAPTADLQKAWPGRSQEEIILEILAKGELQVGDKERGQQLEMLQKEVVQIVAEKCVDPGTGRVYTTGMIEKALEGLMAKSQAATNGNGESSSSAAADNGEKGKEKAKDNEKETPRWTGVVTSKSAKSQALEAIKALLHYQPVPIARARMRLRIFLPSAVAKKIKPSITDMCDKVLDEDFGGDGWNAEVICEPGMYRQINDMVGKEAKGRGRVEVLDTAVIANDED
ncbi:Ribosome maturation protein SBDS [Drechslerella dactyloides]|uniref:Ribosome maturation protein SBDS n=1 Tax=Drechslerella dactyloides TaxID=74499 RepID=A0AAD6J534_DREDA|nr:Ribosome maturation protein SBDS [Drechslerella dactyloides]